MTNYKSDLTITIESNKRNLKVSGASSHGDYIGSIEITLSDFHYSYRQGMKFDDLIIDVADELGGGFISQYDLMHILRKHLSTYLISKIKQIIDKGNTRYDDYTAVRTSIGNASGGNSSFDGFSSVAKSSVGNVIGSDDLAEDE